MSGSQNSLAELEEFFPHLRFTQPIESDRLSDCAKGFQKQVAERIPELNSELWMADSMRGKNEHSSIAAWLGSPANGELSVVLISEDFAPEVSIYIGRHHEHCDAKESVDLLEELLSEKVVVVIERLGRAYVRSWLALPNDILGPAAYGVTGAIPLGCLAQFMPVNFYNLTVQSWKGTHDRFVSGDDAASML